MLLLRFIEVFERGYIMKRNSGIDLVKSYAAFAVILIHHLSRIGFYLRPMISKEVIGTLFIYPILHSCVPLFFISTGYLLRNRKPDKYHYFGLILFLFESFVFIAVGTIIENIFISKVGFNLSNIFQNFIAAPYFIGFYIVVYCFAPFINVFYKALENDDQKMKLAITTVVFVSLPSFFSFFPNKLLPDILSQSYPIMYYLAGLYIHEFGRKISMKSFFGLITTLCALFTIVILLLEKGKPYSMSIGYYENIVTFFVSILIFNQFLKINIENTFVIKLLKIVSKNTFGVFLFSGTYFADIFANRIIPLTPYYKLNLVTMFPTAILSMTIALLVSVIVKLFTNYIAKRAISSLKLIAD